MSRYFEMLMEDVRFREGLKSCMNCGICTGVCPAAEFYDYDPRQIVAIVQTRDEEQIERLLKGDTIWFCGECMSCRPRCPRGNTPGYVIQALRTLSQKLGFFVESEKGRQQLALKRTIGENILRTGYCVTPKLVAPDLHPEQGPVWSWVYRNVEGDSNRLEQEMIFYLEKLDITEEKVRLQNHCRYFREVAADEETPGRKLGFIAQEMGREINTMGSKANESNIQILVVKMKDELEKIKEQVLNIL